MQVKGVCTLVIKESLVTSHISNKQIIWGWGLRRGWEGWIGFFPTTKVGNIIFCIVYQETVLTFLPNIYKSKNIETTRV